MFLGRQFLLNVTQPEFYKELNRQMNDINCPPGVLQPPLYDPKLDDAPNYGNTGGTIGHELTHGFDDEDRQFDAKGNLRDWWTSQHSEQFEKRAQCIVDQYAQYVIVDDIKINSKLTDGEDVADLGGLILAYVAWKAQTKSLHLENRDGFIPDQRFFIGYAQWACENQRPENLRVNAITNPHSPGKYRVRRPGSEHAGVSKNLRMQGRSSLWCAKTAAVCGRSEVTFLTKCRGGHSQMRNTRRISFDAFLNSETSACTFSLYDTLQARSSFVFGFPASSHSFRKLRFFLETKTRLSNFTFKFSISRTLRTLNKL